MSRWFAVSLALFVTVLWSTSYILNKWAFAEGIGPLTLAGLRYAVAVVTLALVHAAGAARTRAREHSTFTPSAWQYVGLGIAGYLMAQGLQYVGQYYVTPTQASLVLSIGNTLLVLLVSALWLRELPSARQWPGVILALAAVGAYYYPWRLAAGNLMGILFILASGVGYAVQLAANRRLLGRGASPMNLVLFPMAVGAAGMLALGLALEPWHPLSWRLVGILLWLGCVNGALAFFLWTYSQRGLQAFESNVLNNSMLLQIATLDVIFLHRPLSWGQLATLVAAGVGIATVQLVKRRTLPGNRVPAPDGTTQKSEG